MSCINNVTLYQLQRITACRGMFYMLFNVGRTVDGNELHFQVCAMTVY